MDALTTFEILSLAGAIIGVYTKLTQEIGKLKGRVVALEKTETEVKAMLVGAAGLGAGDQDSARKEGHRMKWFTYEEFDSPDVPGSGHQMRDEFLDKLDLARGIAGVPFRINSGMRSYEVNQKCGGTPNSSHLIGWAADISATSSNRRFLIVQALMEVGFNRIGIGDTFVHVDCDPDKVGNVIWLY